PSACRNSACPTPPTLPLPNTWLTSCTGTRKCWPSGLRSSAAAALWGGLETPTTQPTAILFNGGVFKAGPLRERVVAVLNQWAKTAGVGPVKVLEGNDLDLAVA